MYKLRLSDFFIHSRLLFSKYLVFWWTWKRNTRRVWGGRRERFFFDANTCWMTNMTINSGCLSVTIIARARQIKRKKSYYKEQRINRERRTQYSPEGKSKSSIIEEVEESPKLDKNSLRWSPLPCKEINNRTCLIKILRNIAPTINLTLQNTSNQNFYTSFTSEEIHTYFFRFIRLKKLNRD